MPAIRGKSKRQIGYKIPLDLEKKMNQLIDNEEFSNFTELITVALREFFIRRDLLSQGSNEGPLQIAEAVEKYLASRKERKK